jgi:hypothetical protein
MNVFKRPLEELQFDTESETYALSVQSFAQLKISMSLIIKFIDVCNAFRNTDKQLNA